MTNGEAPVTRKELQQILRTELDQVMEKLREGFRDELRSAIVDSETRLLTAFYSYARGNDKNVHDLGLSIVGMRERIEMTERRLLDIEMRMNLPPGAKLPPDPTQPSL